MGYAIVSNQKATRMISAKEFFHRMIVIGTGYLYWHFFVSTIKRKRLEVLTLFFVSTIKRKRLEVLTLFEPALLPQRNIKHAQLRHFMALCTVVQVLEEVSTMLMLLLLSLLQPKLLKYSIEEDWEVGRGGEEEGQGPGQEIRSLSRLWHSHQADPNAIGPKPPQGGWKYMWSGNCGYHGSISSNIDTDAISCRQKSSPLWWLWQPQRQGPWPEVHHQVQDEEGGHSFLFRGLLTW